MRFVNLQKMTNEKREKYINAYDALNELLEVEDGPDLVDRCYSEVKHEVNKELYTKRNNLKESNAVINTKRIIDKPIKYGFVDLRFPLSDHARLWNKDGKPFSYTSEPYNLSKNDMKKLMDHCEKYGLDFHISNNSFHYPAGTLFIEIKKQK